MSLHATRQLNVAQQDYYESFKSICQLGRDLHRGRLEFQICDTLG